MYRAPQLASRGMALVRAEVLEEAHRTRAREEDRAEVRPMSVKEEVRVE